MKKRKILISISAAVAVTIAVIGYLFVNQNSNTLTNIPDITPRTNGSGMSAEYLNALHSVERLREEIKNYPKMIKNYVKLAQIFLQESRVTGRHHEYIPKAQTLLHEALKIAPNNFEALVTEASVQMTLHQFAKAKELAEKALPLDKYNAYVYGVLVDANVELGHYHKAVKICNKMLSIRPNLTSYSRASYLRQLFGQKRAACRAMVRAANAGMPGSEQRSWSLYHLGNIYFKEGKIDTAESIFKGILKERHNYAFALSGLAEVNIIKKHYGKAIELLVKASQLNPNHKFIQQLADVYHLTGQKESEQQINKKVLKAFQLHKIDGYDIHYEYAKFCSNHNIHLKKALYHAKKEYEIRPDNIDALDTYAWTLFRNRKASEAVPYIEKAMRLNTKRAVIHFHAAEIYNAVGKDKKAMAMIKKCFSENQYVDLIDLSSAKNLYSKLETYASLK